MADSLTSLVKSLTQSVDKLEKRVELVNYKLFNNFNFVSSKLKGLSDNLQIVDNRLNRFSSVFTDEYVQTLSDKLQVLTNVFNNVYSIMSVDVKNIKLSDVLIDIYDKNFTKLNDNPIKPKSINSINSLYNLELEGNNFSLKDNIFFLKIYYNVMPNKIHNFDLVENYKKSADYKAERYVFNNNINLIAKNLVNYKIYLKDRESGEVINIAPIVTSNLVNSDIVDIVCFSLFDDNMSVADINEKYSFTIQEELFDSILLELVVDDYLINDVGNVLLGRAERNLKTGRFVVYDKAGNIVVETVSERFNNKETRKIKR